MTELLLALFVLVYVAGLRAVWSRAGVGRGIRLWQVECFAGAVVVLVIALFSPLDDLADELFAAHMVQHLLLAIVAPPLLVLSAPSVAVTTALPRAIRVRVVQAIKHSRVIASAWRWLTTPAVACAAFAVALWSWHLPTLFGAALVHPALHALEHISFLVSGSLLWWSIIHPRHSRRQGYGTGIITLFATTLQSGALGALITLSHRVWYPLQTRPSVWQLTPLDDQHLAGLIMWVPGGLLYLVAMGIVFLAFMRSVARHVAVPASSAMFS